MTDPRFTDPQHQDSPRITDPQQQDPRLGDPVLRRNESVGMWGWIAGLSVLALIAFVLIAGWNSDSNTVANSSGPAPVTTGSTAPVRNVTPPPSTTGSGSTAPTRAPSTPAPASGGAQ